MRWWFGRIDRIDRIEQWSAGPHFHDVIDAQVRMLKQVHGLSIDLERILGVQQIRIESLTRPYYCITTRYGNS